MIDLRFPKCTFTSFNRVPIDDDDVAEEIKKIRNDFLTNEVNTRRSGAIETNIKMKKVMDAWIGTTIEDIFREWKIAVENSASNEKERTSFTPKKISHQCQYCLDAYLVRVQYRKNLLLLW